MIGQVVLIMTHEKKNTVEMTRSPMDSSQKILFNGPTLVADEGVGGVSSWRWIPMVTFTKSPLPPIQLILMAIFS